VDCPPGLGAASSRWRWQPRSQLATPKGRTVMRKKLLAIAASTILLGLEPPGVH
jgi:hypothetical protein